MSLDVSFFRARIGFLGDEPGSFVSFSEICSNFVIEDCILFASCSLWFHVQQKPGHIFFSYLML